MASRKEVDRVAEAEAFVASCAGIPEHLRQPLTWCIAELVKNAAEFHLVPDASTFSSKTFTSAERSSLSVTHIPPSSEATPEALGPSTMPLPAMARIKYSDRASDPDLAHLDILGFLRAEYGPWLNGALSRNALAELDMSAYRAVDNWLRRTGRPLPDDIRLPTQKELNDALIARGAVPVEDATRIARLLESRKRRQRAAQSA